MKLEKLKSLIKIGLIPLLIFMKFIFMDIEYSFNHNIVEVVNGIFIVTLIGVSILYLSGDKLTKFVKNYKRIINGIIIFLTYFVYQELLAGIFVIILKLIGITKLNNFLTQIIYILITLIYLIFVIFIYRKELINSLKKIKSNYRNYLEVGIPLYMLGLFLMIFFNFVFQFVFHLEGPKNESEINNLVKIMPVYVFFAASIGAPFIEELIFRKTLSEIFKNKVLFILLSGFIFGALHVIGTITSPTDLLYILPYGSLGFVFAYMYKKTNNILIPMSCHFIHNTVLIILQLTVMK